MDNVNAMDTGDAADVVNGKHAVDATYVVNAVDTVDAVYVNAVDTVLMQWMLFTQ